MRYVILRDDDTCAVTPIECLERLYRPFLDRGLPVNLSVIPEVRLDLTTPDGRLEGFLIDRNGQTAGTKSIGENVPLTRYLLKTPGYHIVQHGCHHDRFEFAMQDRQEIVRRLEHGSAQLVEAGFPRPQTFVAPHDRFSSATWTEAARRFYVLSTGWFELRQLPKPWWPRYARKKLFRARHWQVDQTVLLSHPGCLLSYARSPASILEEVVRVIRRQRLTVLVTHWWEYFRDRNPDEAFINTLHQTAHFLAEDPEIQAVSFAEVAAGKVPLN